MQVVATGQALGPGRVVWRTKRRLAAGAHRLVWAPGRATPSRTYLVRFVVRGRSGSRVYGFEPPGRATTGLVVRVLGVDVAFLQRSFARGAKAAPVSIATDARTVRLQFLSYSAATGPRDPKTSAVVMTPPVPLDWRGHRSAPHVVRVGRLNLERRDSQEALAGDPALTIVASTDPRVYGVHPVEPQATARGEFRVNPLYATERRGDRLHLHLQFPSPDYEDEYGACKEYLLTEATIASSRKRNRLPLRS